MAKDRTISLNCKLYEAPVQLIAQQVTLLYHEHDPARVEILFKGQSYGFLNPLDLHVNCRVRRYHNRYLSLRPSSPKNMSGGKLPFRPKSKENDS